MSEKPSPIDGLIHSSLWSKLHDLEARIERLEAEMPDHNPAPGSLGGDEPD